LTVIEDFAYFVCFLLPLDRMYTTNVMFRQCFGGVSIFFRSEVAGRHFYGRMTG